MGVTRIDELPEERARRALLDARAASRGLKGAPQRTSGASLAFFTSESEDTHDWSGRLDSLALSGGGYASLAVTLTALTALVPMADIAVTLYVSNDGVTWTEYSYAQGMADNYNGTNPRVTRETGARQGAEVSPKTSVFAIRLYGEYNKRVAVKIQAVGNDESTIDVERVA